MRVLTFAEDGRPETEGGRESIPEGGVPERGWIWIDLDGSDTRAERELMINTYGLSELVVADALRERHPPKFEEFDDCLFLLLRGVSPDTMDIDYKTIQIGMFVGARFLITRHSTESPSVERVWRGASNRTRVPENPAQAAYRISRSIVDRYTPILLGMEGRLDDLEDQLFDEPNDELLSELVNYNRNLRKMRRTLTYQHAAVEELLESESSLVTDHREHEFNDVLEHFHRLMSLATVFQEIVSDLMNAYLSLTSYRINRIMSVLTVVAAVFLPLTLIAGIYGMNFEYMPELGMKWAYFGVLGLMAVVGIGIVVVLKRLHWL